MIKNKKKQEFNEFVLISACKGTNYDSIYTQELDEALSKLFRNYKTVNGCYNNETEISFYVPISKEVQKSTLLRLGEHFEQHSILYVDKNRQAYLIECADGHTTNIGTFKQVPKAFALQHVAYTYDITNNGYYVTTKTPIKD